MCNDSDNEFDLWKAYIKTVKPLSKDQNSQAFLTKAIEIKHNNIHISSMDHVKPLYTPSPQPIPNKIKSVKQHDFSAEKNAKKRMNKGKFTYNTKIDLHGMTQNQAFDCLISFITDNHHKQNRHLLVITGRGHFCHQTGISTGILIKKVPEWLQTPPLASMVSVIEKASKYDGGEGALYVILNKTKI